MYAEYFGLQETPFSIAPNPRYLYLSQQHKDALAHLRYGIGNEGGFILLTGEVGTGKTTLCRCLLAQLPEGVEVAFVLNPRLTATELLASICEEFGIGCPADASLKLLVDRLNSHLLTTNADGRRCVLIIDEAQQLSPDVLEQLRLLTNLETNERKLLQILLLGQPELLELLGKKELRQLSQRITARYHLTSLDRAETASYIRHRLAVAGTNAALFTSRAVRRIYGLTGGVPRLINLICDRALLGAFARNRQVATGRIVARAAREVLGPQETSHRGLAWAASVALVFVVGAAAYEMQTSAGQRLLSGINVDSMFRQPFKRLFEQEAGELTTAPAKLEGHQNSTDAYHDLFALWGRAFAEQAAPPCELAEEVGLGCYEVSADLNTLLSLNRPAVVQVKGSWFVLSQVVGNQLTLIAGNRQYEVAASHFQTLWDGEGHLFWHMPPDYEAPLAAGDGAAAGKSAAADGEDAADDTPSWIRLNSAQATDDIPVLRLPGS